MSLINQYEQQSQPQDTPITVPDPVPPEPAVQIQPDFQPTATIGVTTPTETKQLDQAFNPPTATALDASTPIMGMGQGDQAPAVQQFLTKDAPNFSAPGNLSQQPVTTEQVGTPLTDVQNAAQQGVLDEQLRRGQVEQSALDESYLSQHYIPTLYTPSYGDKTAPLLQSNIEAIQRLGSDAYARQQESRNLFRPQAVPAQPGQPDTTRSITQGWGGWLTGLAESLFKDNGFNPFKGHFGSAGNGFVGALLYGLGVVPNTFAGLLADADRMSQNAAKTGTSVTPSVGGVPIPYQQLGQAIDRVVPGFSRGFSNVWNYDIGQATQRLLFGKVSEPPIDPVHPDPNYRGSYTLDALRGRQYSFSEYERSPSNSPIGIRQSGYGRWYRDPTFWAGIAADIFLDPTNSINEAVSRLGNALGRPGRITATAVHAVTDPIGLVMGHYRPEVKVPEVKVPEPHFAEAPDPWVWTQRTATVNPNTELRTLAGTPEVPRLPESHQLLALPPARDEVELSRMVEHAVNNTPTQEVDPLMQRLERNIRNAPVNTPEPKAEPLTAYEWRRSFNEGVTSEVRKVDEAAVPSPVLALTHGDRTPDVSLPRPSGAMIPSGNSVGSLVPPPSVIPDVVREVLDNSTALAPIYNMRLPLRTEGLAIVDAAGTVSPVVELKAAIAQEVARTEAKVEKLTAQVKSFDGMDTSIPIIKENLTTQTAKLEQATAKLEQVRAADTQLKVEPVTVPLPVVSERIFKGEMTPVEIAKVLSTLQPGTYVNGDILVKERRTLDQVLALMKITPAPDGKPLASPTMQRVKTWAWVRQRLLDRGVEDPAVFRMFERHGAAIPVEALNEPSFRVVLEKGKPLGIPERSVVVHNEPVIRKAAEKPLGDVQTLANAANVQTIKPKGEAPLRTYTVPLSDLPSTNNPLGTMLKSKREALQAIEDAKNFDEAMAAMVKLDHIDTELHSPDLTTNTARLKQLQAEVIPDNQVGQSPEVIRLTMDKLEAEQFVNDASDEVHQLHAQFIEQQRLLEESRSKLDEYHASAGRDSLDTATLEPESVTPDRPTINDNAFHPINDSNYFHGSRVANWSPALDPIAGGRRAEWGTAHYLSKDVADAMPHMEATTAENLPKVAGREFGTPTLYEVQPDVRNPLDALAPASDDIQDLFTDTFADVFDIGYPETRKALGAIRKKLSNNPDLPLGEYWGLAERAIMKYGSPAETDLLSFQRKFNEQLVRKGYDAITDGKTIGLLDGSNSKVVQSATQAEGNVLTSVAARFNADGAVAREHPTNISAQVQSMESNIQLQAQLLYDTEKKLRDAEERQLIAITHMMDKDEQLAKVAADEQRITKQRTQMSNDAANEQLNRQLSKPPTDPCTF